jgi:regulator of replication initiation timing
MGPPNQLKSILPWLSVAALAGGLLFLRMRIKHADQELTALRESNQDLKKALAENEDLKKIQVQVDEVARLRKENEELHRLRNEVRQLREEKQGAARAARISQSAPAQPKADGSAQPQLQQQLQQLLAENERLRAENQQFQQLQSNAPANACLNNLRILQGAKEQWALEAKKPDNTAVNAEDILPYLKNNSIPTCPQGGVYTLNAVGAMPTCNLPGHVLPPQ